MNKYKILQANNYFYLRGGSEKYLFCLMGLLRDMGHEVVPFSTENVLNPPSPYAEFFAGPFEPEGIATLCTVGKLRIAARVLYYTQARERIGRLIDKSGPDLAHCHNIYGALSPSVLGTLKKRGLPVVLTLHDTKLLCPNHRMYIKHAVCERCKLNKFYECAINKCIGDSWAASFLGSIEQYVHRLSGIYKKNIDLFIAPSEFVRQKFMEYGFSEKMIVRIPNFIDSEKYEPSYDHDRYMIYFGRLEESKGLGTLMTAARQFKGIIDLVITGDGPMRADLEKEVRQKNLTHVKLTGHKKDKELTDIVRKALFSIVPSELYENSPYSIFESFACGKAVIGSRIGGIPELIEEGKTGLTFRPSDANDLVQKIELLVRDPKLACEMGRAARERVEKEFGPEGHYEKIVSVYRKLL